MRFRCVRAVCSDVPRITGTFEMHGAPKEEHVYAVKSWWLQANCDGTLVTMTNPGATVYWIVIQFARPYQGLHFKRYGLTKRDGKLMILDRVKKR
jgi:hypothetical protein